MNIDPRLRDLLAKYPLDLTDEELAELRAGAEADPRVDQIMDGILEVDDQLDDTPVPLSDAGRSRLDALVSAAHEAKGWSADLATPAAQTEDEAKGWSADLATPAAQTEDEAKGWSADLATPRRRSRDRLTNPVKRRRSRLPTTQSASHISRHRGRLGDRRGARPADRATSSGVPTPGRTGGHRGGPLGDGRRPDTRRRHPIGRLAGDVPSSP